MMDTAVRLVYREIAVNEYGMAIKVWAEDEELACGYDATAIKQVMDGAQVILTDARLRLPNGTTLDNRDRAKGSRGAGTGRDVPPPAESLGGRLHGPSGLLI